MTEAMYSALLAYGVSNVILCTDMAKLRALARVYAWRAVVAAVAGDYDFTDAGSTYNRSQITQNAQDALALAEADAWAYLPGGVITRQPFTLTDNPYRRVD
jgi:hypothetical protein